MGRGRNTNIMGPAGVCDACGRTCMTLCQVGIQCYHCQAGVFQGRAKWNYWDCPACKGDLDPLCEFCHGWNIVAVPRES